MTDDLAAIADAADVVYSGYAFTSCDLGYRVLNLHAPDQAAVISLDGNVLETTMNDFDLQLMGRVFNRCRKYLAA